MSLGFRMSIRAELGEVAKVNSAVAEFVAAQGVPASVRRSLHVVLDELLANSAMHGLAGREDGTVTVEAAVAAGRLTVTIRDNGTAFDPFARAAPDTTLSVKDRPIGGLGIHLVQQLVDEVSYRRDDTWNVVGIVKRLEGNAGDGHRGDQAMQITTRTHDDVTIVAISGNLDSTTSPQAQQALDVVVAGGAKKIAIDFSQLDYISSAGLRVMLGTAKKLGATGGGLHAFGLNQTVREVFDISGFSAILHVFPSEAESRSGF